MQYYYKANMYMYIQTYVYLHTYIMYAYIC